jgi:hypothetical protein
MAFIRVDLPGEVHWFAGYEPAPVLGECPHVGCPHNALTTIAWGPDVKHYELVTCDADCGGNCRAWVNGRTVATTPWLKVDASVLAATS